MDNSFVYGLDIQSRALAPITADTEKAKFVIGTQSLKQSSNQIHLIEYNEEDSTLIPQIFHHNAGEIWKLISSPLDSSKIAVCYSSFNGNTCSKKSHILKFPEEYDCNIINDLEITNTFDTQCNRFNATEFHPVDKSRAASVTDKEIIIWDISDNSKIITKISSENRNNVDFSSGKWNPHHSCNQFAALTDKHLKSYDTRTGEVAWDIDSCDNIFLRDIDFNLNKQYYVASCGDDSFLRVWDYRYTSKPIFIQNNHNHWIFSVRFNPFHDQLILTASSDGCVILTSAASVSSENTIEPCLNKEFSDLETKQILSDGLLQCCEHEDSVYCAEWSPAEPWLFATLSHDGRLLLTRIKKSIKYQIML